MAKEENLFEEKAKEEGVKTFSLPAYGKDLVEDRLPLRRLCITLQDGHALHRRNACLKQHGSLITERSDLFIRK